MLSIRKNRHLFINFVSACSVVWPLIGASGVDSDLFSSVTKVWTPGLKWVVYYGTTVMVGWLTGVLSFGGRLPTSGCGRGYTDFQYAASALLLSL